MSGYVASARIVGVEPRLARPGRLADDAAWIPAAAGTATSDIEERALSTSGRSVLADRLGAIRERWSQLTFFLFDPDSWRS